MNGGYTPKNVVAGPGQIISGVVTNQVISKEGFPITAGGANRCLVIKLKVSGVTSVGTITAKLQTAIDSDYVDSKTVVITANGDFYIKLNNAASADQTFFPLLSKGQVVITTTNAGDAVSITSINVLQEV